VEKILPSWHFKEEAVEEFVQGRLQTVYRPNKMEGIQMFDKADQEHLSAIYRVYLNERRYIRELDSLNCTFVASIDKVSSVLGEKFSLNEITESDHSKRGIGSTFGLASAYSDSNKRLLERCQFYIEYKYDCSLPPLENPDHLQTGKLLLLGAIANAIVVSSGKVSA